MGTVTIAVTNRAGVTRDFTVTDEDRASFLNRGRTDEEIAVIRATGAGHVRRTTNPISVVRREG